MIVVCGEALVDLTPARCGGEDGFIPRPGGSPFNVAVGLARLEVPTAFVGRLSADRFGRTLRQRLEDEGVDLTGVAVGPEPTPLAIVHVDEGGHPAYSFHWEGTADRLLAAADLPSRLPAGVGALHVGSVSLALEPAASSIAALAERERPRHLISLDPNIRPAVIGDAGRHRARMRDWIRRADLVKVSDEDLAWLSPTDEPLEVARRWLDDGLGLVVVTRGDAGAIGLTAEVEVSVRAASVEVVDTVGAGDSFEAGLLAALDERALLEREALGGLGRQALDEVLRFATAVAAGTCQRAGADPPRLHEVSSP